MENELRNTAMDLYNKILAEYRKIDFSTSVCSLYHDEVLTQSNACSETICEIDELLDEGETATASLYVVDLRNTLNYCKKVNQMREIAKSLTPIYA